MDKPLSRRKRIHNAVAFVLHHLKGTPIDPADFSLENDSMYTRLLINSTLRRGWASLNEKHALKKAIDSLINELDSGEKTSTKTRS